MLPPPTTTRRAHLLTARLRPFPVGSVPACVLRAPRRSSVVFSSVEFLFLFMPLTVGAYFLLPHRLRNAWLLLSSVIFYSWGGAQFLLVLGVSVVADYLLGFLAASGYERDHRPRKRLAVGLSVLVNLGLLGYFKYANFFVDEFGAALGRLGFEQADWAAVALPIGISFFTFQSMSYTIDVARGAARHLRNPLDFAMYVALFPQLIAGPIVRYHEMARDIARRHISRSDFSTGAVRFGHGLAKKVIIADVVGPLADVMFAASAGDLSAAEAWLGVIAYTIQIYFDFSGYSDMAIGLGRMFGFTFPENFNRPYSAVSITDFWRRWHITLSNWFRDYVYLPLGGSRVGTSRTYVNLIFVFLVTGLWHGANWTFVVWGAYHGVLLIGERLTGQRPVGNGPASLTWLRRSYTLMAVMLGWVLFRAPSFTDALQYYRAMIPVGGFGTIELVETPTRLLILLIAGCLVALLPRNFSGSRLISTQSGFGPVVARYASQLLAMPYAAALVLSGTFSPFLYFQF